MKSLLFTLLTLLAFNIYAQKPLRYKSKTLISNGSTEIKLKETGFLNTIKVNGIKILQNSGVVITKSGQEVKDIEFKNPEHKILGQTLEITSSFTNKKDELKLITKVTIHGQGVIVDHVLEGKKSYTLKASQLLFTSESFEGTSYKIGPVNKPLLTRDQAKGTWNAFQGDVPAMYMTLGMEDEKVSSGVYFKDMTGSFSIVLANASEWYDDYIVKLLPTKPGRITYYLALPKEVATSSNANKTAQVSPQKKNVIQAQALAIANSQTIKNKRSLIRMKDVGLMGDVLHVGETLVKGLSPIIKKNGKVFNVPFGITKNSTIEGNKLIIKNDFKYQGDEFQFTMTAVAGNGYVDFSYDLKASEGIEFVGATVFMDYATFKGGAFKLDGQGYKYKTKEEVENDWNYLIWSRPSKMFTASNNNATNLKIEFANGEKGKMEMILQKDGFFKDYMLKMYQSNPDAPLQFRMTLPKGGELSLPQGVRDNENQIKNGGFETGTHGWGATFDGFDTESLVILDEKIKTEGNNSLRLDIGEVKLPVPSPHQNVSLTSEFVKLGGSIEMTYSVDLKANVDGLPVQMKVNYQQTDGVANKGTIAEVKKIKLTKDWKRYTFQLQLPKGLFDAFSVGIKIPKAKAGTQVWVDAVQFNPGTKVEYAATNEIEIGGNTPDKYNLYSPNEEVKLTSLIKNNSSKNREVKVKMTVLDPDYYKVLQAEKELTLQPNSLAKNPIKENIFTSSKKGAYRVYLSVEEEGKEVDRYFYSFGIVEQIKDKKLNTASRFGLHMGGHRFLEAADLASRIGYNWLRNGAFFNNWSTFEMNKGQYSQWLINRNLKTLDLLEEKGLTMLGQIGVQVPKWASSAPKGSNEWKIYPPKPEYMEDYQAYVEKVVETYKGRVYAYEIWNEPNGSPFFRGTAKEFAPLLQKGYEGIKNVDPNVEVLAFGLTHYGKTAQNFLKNVFKEIGSEYCDVVSFHPYTDGRLSPDRTHVVHQFDKINKDIKSFGEEKPLWATEYGFFNPQKGSKTYTPFKNKDVPKRLVSEEEAARFYVQETAIAFSNGTEKAFYFIFQEGDIANRWFHGFIGVNGERLKSIYYAGAACVANLDYSESLGLEKAFGDVSIAKFKREGKVTSLLWKTDGGKDVTIKTDQPIEGQDINGNPFIVYPYQGKVFLTLGEDPIYLYKDIDVKTIQNSPFKMEEYVLNSSDLENSQITLEGKVDANLSVEIQSGALTSSEKQTLSTSIKVTLDKDLMKEERYKTHFLIYHQKKLVGRLEKVIHMEKQATVL